MNPQHILQVSELTKKVRFMLESELNTLWLCGEISNFIHASSGHWYLSLKDAKSQVRCAMFKGANRQVRISPKNGQQVLVRAKVSLYEPRGDFQLIIEQMEDAGVGLLQQKFEQLKTQLTHEGLFALERKKPLPLTPQTIGIITSPTGAAIRDILTVLKRRNPFVNVIIYPALVQGQQAAQDVVNAIMLANSRQECEVLIVGRGGGSLEDLWCFNEEIVVRAMADCRIPIISAVGHETDTTLADYVADLRAPTPSAAAELVVQDVTLLIKKMAQLRVRLYTSANTRQQMALQTLNSLHHRLKRVHPEQQLHQQQQRMDELSTRLHQAITRELRRFKMRPESLTQQLLQLSPLKTIHHQQQQLAHQQQRLTHAMQQLLAQKSHRFAAIIAQLQLVSPLATIARGYSVTRNGQGQIIKHINQLSVGERIRVQLNDGYIAANITDLTSKH